MKITVIIVIVIIFFLLDKGNEVENWKECLFLLQICLVFIWVYKKLFINNRLKFDLCGP